MSTNGKEKMRCIDHFVGPSLVNNNGRTTGGSPTTRKRTAHQGGTVGIGSDADSIVSSRSSSASRSRRGSRNSSISSNSDQGAHPIHVRCFTGVGLMMPVDTAWANSTSDDSKLSLCHQVKQQRRRSHPKDIYEQYSSVAWPIYCSEYYYTSLYPGPMVCGRSKRSVDHTEVHWSSYPALVTPLPSFIYPIIVPTSYKNAKLDSPPERRWVPIQNINVQQKLASLTTMSYNILCDNYVSSSLYAFSPPWSLNWAYRKRLIFHQLQKYNPDIIALQEVETKQYWTYFKPKLELMGYAGIFSAKSRAKTMNEEERQTVDGCALFWKADKFELCKEHVIEFTQLAIANAERSEHMLNRVMTRDNIALAAVLQLRNGEDGGLAGCPLVVCSTHVHWDPQYCDVKLVQTMMLTQELSSLVDQTARDYDLDKANVPLLICGDLNSTEDSSVYEFITTGSIDANHPDFKDFRGQTCLRKLSSSDGQNVYSHDLQLIPAYEIGTMPFTNYTCDFKGVIDYIFSSPNLVCESVLGPLESEWFEENDVVACPCPYIPSDHIPLVAQHSIVLAGDDGTRGTCDTGC